MKGFTETIIFEELIGFVFTKVFHCNELEQLIFYGDKAFKFYHDQDCCEVVVIEDICGELSDLIGVPILRAEETGTVEKNNENEFNGNTWTFYRFETEKGCVVIKWHGSSNGYYSENVHFQELKLSEAKELFEK